MPLQLSSEMITSILITAIEFEEYLYVAIQIRKVYPIGNLVFEDVYIFKLLNI